MEGAHNLLQEAEEIIHSRAKELEQARQRAELHNALKDQEQQVTEGYEEEYATLKQKVLEKKAKLRQSWKSSCEHLAGQDALITANIADLKHRLSDPTR